MFIFTIAWSQTDHENIAVEADNRDDAWRMIQDKFANCAQYHRVSELKIDRIIK